MEHLSFTNNNFAKKKYCCTSTWTIGWESDVVTEVDNNTDSAIEAAAKFARQLFSSHSCSFQDGSAKWFNT